MDYIKKLPRPFLAACFSLALLCAYAPHPLTAGADPAVQKVKNESLHPATPLETKSQPGQLYGLYRAVVISHPDPHMRVQIEIPDLKITGEWASACVPPGSTAAPTFNSQVWVMFEQGNSHLPVWMGTIPGN